MCQNIHVVMRRRTDQQVNTHQWNRVPCQKPQKEYCKHCQSVMCQSGKVGGKRLKPPVPNQGYTDTVTQQRLTQLKPESQRQPRMRKTRPSHTMFIIPEAGWNTLSRHQASYRQRPKGQQEEQSIRNPSLSTIHKSP